MTVQVLRPQVDRARDVGLGVTGELQLYFVDGETLRCTDVQGMSVLRCAAQLRSGRSGRPTVEVSRLATHLYSATTGLLIQQNPSRTGQGRLTGLRPGGGTLGDTPSLLPADFVHDEYVVLSLRNRLYLNTDPLVMRAGGLGRTIGVPFRSQAPTVFYDLEDLAGGITARRPHGVLARFALVAKLAVAVRDLVHDDAHPAGG